MAEPALKPGKIPGSLLRELLATARPPPPELLLPPIYGEDAGVIAVKGGALIAATDPITLTSREVGAHAVVINANDVAVMGARPRWFLCALLMPVGTTESDVRALFEAMHAALDRDDIALVGGHTEVTDAVNQPVVVGQMLGLREDGGFVRTGGVSAGDVILQIGGAPIEGAAVLAMEAGQALDAVPRSVVETAALALREPGISVVEPALLATELGAAAMHDPTEGGLSAGLYELAAASGLALRLDPEAVLWFPPGLQISEALGLDPWGVLASGSLLAAFPPDAAENALERLQEAGHPVARIGVAQAGSGVELTSGQPLPRYEIDEVARFLGSAGVD